jgi:hypothetical protein
MKRADVVGMVHEDRLLALRSAGNPLGSWALEDDIVIWAFGVDHGLTPGLRVLVSTSAIAGR